MLFLDYDQGTKVIPEILGKAKIEFRRLSDLYAKNTPDYRWIPECARQGWVIVSSDKGIETDPENREAVIASKAKIVLLDENNSKAATWAAALIVSRQVIADMLEDCGEACVLCLKNTGSLVHSQRFPHRSKIEDERKRAEYRARKATSR